MQIYIVIWVKRNSEMLEMINEFGCSCIDWDCN